MLKQIYGNYTEENHKVWTMLYSRIMQMLPESADQSVLDGIKMIGFPSDRIPNFEEINEKIRAFADWEIVPLEDMVGDKEFIGMLAERKYPCRTWIRSEQQLESEEDEYDMFHDVIGHTTLLTKPNYCKYLTGLGNLALKYIKNDDAIALLKRVYWHTIQFGLKVSDNSLKIYGAHLLSSSAETIYSLSAGVPKYDLHIEKIMDTPYKKGSFQERYFVINKYEDLYNSLAEIERELQKRVK
jgi:phenylalanine-4-hydroxylase